MQRVSNNPLVDAIDGYTIVNLSVGIEILTITLSTS